MTRLITSGVSTIDIDEPPIKFTVVDVGGQRNERKKWLHCFDDVKAVVFLISLAGYNQVCVCALCICMCISLAGSLCARARSRVCESVPCDALVFDECYDAPLPTQELSRAGVTFIRSMVLHYSTCRRCVVFTAAFGG